MQLPHDTAPPRMPAAGLRARVLVVDDDPYLCENLRAILGSAGHETAEAAEGQQALDLLDAQPIDLVLLDLVLKRSRRSGLDVLRAVAADHPHVPVIIISGEGTIRAAVEATQLGAYDFLEKPVSQERILLTVRNALEKVCLERDRDRLLDEALGPGQMVGASAAMRGVREMIERAAQTDSKVLITGESGSGKEIVAQAIHRGSARAQGPFVAVNCAALPGELIESELFGYEKGAFTGAARAHQGKFEQANGGTLFLDEIGDMSPKTQATILRILESGAVIPLGGTAGRPVDVRLIAATHKDLQAGVEAGTFREDLYYRVNVLHLHVPPLRERQEDIPALVAHFLAHFWKAEGLPLKQLTDEALALMARHDWPGNVRELRNVTERLIVLSDGATVGPEDVARAIGDARSHVVPAAAAAQPTSARPLQEAVGEYERSCLVQALIAHGWNRQETAAALAIDRTQLWRKMQRYGIEAPPGA